MSISMQTSLLQGSQEFTNSLISSLVTTSKTLATPAEPVKKIGSDDEKSSKNESKKDSSSSQQLTESEQTQVKELEAKDREVRAHEQSHIAASGGLAGGLSFTYQQGPDGRNYAIGGSVSIDTSAANNPDATLEKARRIRSSALAPSDPSSQDSSVAASANALEQQAQKEKAALEKEKEKDSSLTADSDSSIDSAQSANASSPIVSALNAQALEEKETLKNRETTQNSPADKMQSKNSVANSQHALLFDLAKDSAQVFSNLPAVSAKNATQQYKNGFDNAHFDFLKSSSSNLMTV